MEALQPFTDIFGLNLIAISAMSVFIFYWIRFLKSQFIFLRGIYTTLINLVSSFLITYAYLIKQSVEFDSVTFIMSAIMVWIFSVAGYINHKSKSNGGIVKYEPAFRIDDGQKTEVRK